MIEPEVCFGYYGSMLLVACDVAYVKYRISGLGVQPLKTRYVHSDTLAIGQKYISNIV